MDFTIKADVNAVPQIRPAQAAQQSANKEPNSNYGQPPQIPTMEAIDGIKFDFNDGIRIFVPKDTKEYLYKFSDDERKVVLFCGEIKPETTITSLKKYFIRFKFEILDKETGEVKFTHTYDASNRVVTIHYPGGTLGDTIGWFSFAERFQRKHNCQLVCFMHPNLSNLFKDQYPNITFDVSENAQNYKPYASYYMGLFFKGEMNHQPSDFRFTGNHRTVSYILDVDHSDIPPRFNLSKPRIIKEKYVCIGAQASSRAKMWNNPFGWLNVIRYLKAHGYRVLCMDKFDVYGDDKQFNIIPNGAEDFTGDISLQERIDIIKDADFYIGLSSGLSWIAWGCLVPVIMISGFSHPLNEFINPYRVFNPHTCHSCWNHETCDFDHFDYHWCPFHKGTDRQYECTKMITPEYVIDTINKIPTFQPKPGVALVYEKPAINYQIS